MANRRWTMDEINTTGTIDFAKAILYERESNLTNGYAPLTVKLEQTRSELDEIRTKLELAGNNGFVVDNNGHQVRVFVNVLDYFKSINIEIFHTDESEKSRKTPFITTAMPNECFIKEIVDNDYFTINGQRYTRIMQPMYLDATGDLPVYIRDRTLRREVYLIYTRRDKESYPHAESKFTFKTWGEAEAYMNSNLKPKKER
jgi:hypothetical protein